MNAQELYDEIKGALSYFDLSFYDMKKMDVEVEKDDIVFRYGKRSITVNVTCYGLDT